MAKRQTSREITKVNQTTNQVSRSVQKEDTGFIGFLKSLTYGVVFSPEEGRVDVKVADRSKDRDVSVTFRQGNGEDAPHTQKRKKLEKRR